MLRPDTPVANVKNKVDALVDQPPQLTSLIKKLVTRQGGYRSENFRPCSYCKENGHGANKCLFNPHRDTICPRCGKKGHAEYTCCATISPDALLDAQT